MKVLLLLIICGTFNNAAWAQYGGGSDGGASYAKTSCTAPNIFAGGSYEGFGYNIAFCWSGPVARYTGGSYDGSSLGNQACTATFINIAIGGSESGSSYGIAACPSANIYAGGSYDGTGYGISSCATVATVTKGGSYDGTSYVQQSCSTPAIYAGGSYDGTSYAQQSCSSNNIYAGGSYDGTNYVASSCSSTNIYKGGQADGVAYLSSTCPTVNIYAGGSYEGFGYGTAFCWTGPVARYTGGSYDGFSLGNAACPVTTANIAVGGSYDGTSYAVSGCGNINIYAGGSYNGTGYQASAGCSTTNIYAGGLNAGLGYLLANGCTTTNIYKGGSYAGFNWLQVACPATAMIDVGGSYDGMGYTTVACCFPPVYTAQPSDQNICSGASVSFTINTTSTSGVATYQWQENTGSTWVNITNGGIYSGATSSTLVISGAPVSMNGYKYRCVATVSCGSSTTSNQALLNVGPNAGNFSMPGPVSACVAGPGTVTVNSTTLSSGTYTVTYSLTGTNTGTNNSATMIFTSGNPGSGVFTTSNLNNTGATTCTVTMVTNVSSGCATSLTSGNAVTINVLGNPTTATAGSNQSICQGGTSTALGGNTPTVGTGAWSVTSVPTGGTVTDITFSSTSSGTATATAASGAIPGAYTLTWTISNSPCTASTASLTLTIVGAPTTATVGSDQSVCQGGTTTALGGNTATSGTGVWTVTSVPSGGNASDISFSNAASGSSTASATSGAVAGVYVLTWTISNSPCTASSASLNLTVAGSPSTATVGGNQTVAPGATSTGLGGNTPTSGSGSWSVTSVPSGGNAGDITFSNINDGSATATAASGAVTGNYTLTWTISNSPCSSTSASLTLTVGTCGSMTLTATLAGCSFIDSAHVNTAVDSNLVILNVSGGSAPYSFSGPSGTELRLVLSGTQQVFTAPANNTSFNFTVTDAGSCSANASVTTYTGNPTDIPYTAATGNESAVCYDGGYMKWLTFHDVNNKAILAIFDSSQNLGQLTVTVYKDGIVPQILQSGPSSSCYGYYSTAMQRHFVVTSTATQPFNQAVKVRLFFSNLELDSLKAASVANNATGYVCSDVDDVYSINDLYVTKYDDPNFGRPTEDGSYTNNLSSSAGGIYRVYGTNTQYYPQPTGGLYKDSAGFAAIYPNGQPNHYVQLNVHEFSEFWLNGSNFDNSPLPVTMLYLEAEVIQNSYIQVRWATETEINNNRFDIERSTDAQSWAQIDSLPGHNNTTSETDYTYNDLKVVPNQRYYYRLKQVDNNGSYQYTNIVSAMLIGSDAFVVKGFIPNPSNGNTGIIVTSPIGQDVSVELMDMLGRRVVSETHGVNKGITNLEFDYSRLASGTYTAIITAGTTVVTKKVVITK